VADQREKVNEVIAAIMNHRKQHLEALINHAIAYGLKPLTERRSKTSLQFYDVYSTVQT